MGQAIQSLTHFTLIKMPAKNNYIFLGAGSANMFAILYLLKEHNNTYDPNIIVIDKGLSPYDRRVAMDDRTNGDVRSSLLFGFAGAGLWSDGKMVFADHPYHQTSTSRRDKDMCHKWILETTLGFTKDLPTELMMPVSPSKLPDMDGLSLLQSTVLHIGTKNNMMFGGRVYEFMKDRGVKFMFDTEVIDILLPEKKLIISDGSVIDYTILQVGLGKTGNHLFDKICSRYNLKMGSSYANIGGRFEIPFNENVSNIANNIQYDFKFFKEYNNGISVRTFCTNNKSAYVIKEPIVTKDGRTVMSFNGHAYGMKNAEYMNNLTNFGIILMADGVDSNVVHETLMSQFDDKGTVILGKNVSIDGSINWRSGMRMIDWMEFDSIYSSSVGQIDIGGVFQNFIMRLDNVLKFNNNYIFYLPEIKMSSGVLLTDNNYNLSDGRFKEVSFVGDLTTGGVGIVPSAVSGIMAIKKYM